MILKEENSEESDSEEEEKDVIPEHLKDQLNKFNYYDAYKPVKISLDKIKFSKISCGFHHAIAVTSEGGNAFSWGSNKMGQLGIGKTSEYVE